jgi:TolB-like protein
MSALHLNLLGGFSASSSGGETVEVSGRKNQALLAYLALQSGKRLPRDKLLGLLWSDRGETQARASLRQALVALRHDLGESASALRTDGDSVALEPQMVTTDVAVFERLIRGSSAEELREAARLYEGELLDGLEIRDAAFEEWLAAERGRLHEMVIGCLTRLLVRMPATEATAVGQRLLALDPLREASHRALMRTYAANGQRELALRQYQACRDILRRDLQVEPADKTEALRREIEMGRGQTEPEQSPRPESTKARPAPPLPDKPSIAVLPFINMSGDPEQEYFSDGITEDIITQLSRFRNLLVIARISSFVYKGRAADVKQVGRELGVRYVLEGSVRRAGQHIRVTAQLIDAANGSHIWAERYDRELADIFAVQDEVTSGIVGTLATELEEESLEQARRKHPGNLLAYEHWLRGKKTQLIPGEGKLEARRHFELAVAADPCFSRAYAGLADTYGTESIEFLSLDELHAAREKCFQYALKALSLDEADCEAHTQIAWPYLYKGDWDQAKMHIERAIKLNPNSADTLANAAYLLAALGDATAGIKCGETALRLNPRQPDWYVAFLCFALFVARDYPKALAARLRVPDLFIDSTFIGAAILAHMGRLDEAKRWAERAVVRLSATPGGTAAVAEGRVVELLLENNPLCRQEDRDHFAEGMRKAGVPG